ncbi:hypothetical protein D9757_012522 [Collybiopsis confluens]|uniref:Uncharacterized protein n=1 Tax=Collybiopsis confluens TaxID=2823264 RepID=A0A8H5G1S1_9AGAR|nr:hypothetical protein D9757_012522 [Collybiopsis confluens]
MTPSTYHLVPHLDLFVVGTSVCYLRLSLCSAALLRRLALLICHIIAPHPRYVPSDLFVTDESKQATQTKKMQKLQTRLPNHANAKDTEGLMKKQAP